MKDNLTPSSRPCDVEYRVEAAQKALDKAIAWIRLIDPVAFANSPYGIETCSVLLEKLEVAGDALHEVHAFLPQKSVTRPKKVQDTEA